MAFRIVILAIWFTFLVTSCTSAGKPSTTAPSASVLTQETKETWEKDWNDTLAKAKKEGKVVAHTSGGGEPVRMLTKAFMDKYPLDVEFISSREPEFVGRLMTERKAGIYSSDIMISGLGTALFEILKPLGVVEPLEQAFILPEVLDPDKWWKGLGWQDKEHTALTFAAYPLPSLAINTNSVKAEELKSLKDLLNPVWKGKIVMNDPTVAGTGQRFIGFLLIKAGEDYLKELARQEPVIVRDQRLQVEWLAKGKYAIATSPKSDILIEFTNAGAPIVRKAVIEGESLTAGGGVAALINKAPHPNAAKIFLNWLLSKEGQTVYSQAWGVQSRRLDVSTEHLDPLLIRREGVYYVFQNTEEFISRQPEYAKISSTIFGPYLK